MIVGPQPVGMAIDRPSRDEITPGMTVEIVQEQDNNPGEPLVGDVLKVLTTEHSHPDGIKVKLESGAVGRVKEIRPRA